MVFYSLQSTNNIYSTNEKEKSQNCYALIVIQGWGTSHFQYVSMDPSNYNGTGMLIK